MRWQIVGIRPGIQLHTPHGFVPTNRVDGGATLSEAQASYLRSIGYDLKKIAGPAPDVDDAPFRDPEEVAEGQREAAETQREIERNQRDVLKPLRKKTHNPRGG